MGIRHPFDPGDGTHDPPATLLEILFTLTHDAALLASVMLAAVEQVQERLERLLDERHFADLPLSAVRVEGGIPAADRHPLYPLRAGATVLHARADVVSLAELALQPTVLGKMVFDHAGRAYEAAVEIAWIRREAWDALATRRPSP